MKTRLEKAGLLMTGAAILAAMGAAAYLATVPMYEGYATGTDTAGLHAGPVLLPTETLPEVNGGWVYLILLLPIALAGLPFLAREPLARNFATWFSGVLLSGFCMISAWTVGTFYSPAAVMLLCAAVLLSLGSRGSKVGKAP